MIYQTLVVDIKTLIDHLCVTETVYFTKIELKLEINIRNSRVNSDSTQPEISVTKDN